MRYEYTVHREADSHSQVRPPEFFWHYGPWTECTVTCGAGEGSSGQWLPHRACLGSDAGLQLCIFAGHRGLGQHASGPRFPYL